MANHSVIKWERGYEVSGKPHHKETVDGWYAVFQAVSVANGDWVVTEPFPQDISSDFSVNARKLTGSSTFNLDVEGSINPLSKQKSDTTSWNSTIGSSFTWSVSGNTSAATAGDYFRYDIGENGTMPSMRLAFKNETGSAWTGVWEVVIVFERGD